MRVALIQPSASNDLQKNLEKTTSFLQDAADQGADWCAYRNALTHGFSRNVWEIELRAHAIANDSYVAGVNRVGTERESEYYGARSFVDPMGDSHRASC
jgi:predicted amidohydrolase